jgi:urease accessory protein
MSRATAVTRKLAVKADKVVDTVVLDHEDRHRRRIALTGEKGIEVLMDLEKATVLNDGDALKLEDGSLVLVKAAPEKLVRITAHNPKRLMKVAWHIGNRHTPAEIGEEEIFIQADHVLEEMVRGLGAEVSAVERAFQPERGAYDQGGHGHHHGHGHDHDHGHHDHDHAHHHDHHGHGHHHDHGHAHAHGEPGHVHGPDCGHDHDHHDHGHGHGHKHG